MDFNLQTAPYYNFPILMDIPSLPFRQKWQSDDDHMKEEPFWSVYWPGGQALARYILDNPSTVRGRRVLDVGSG